MTLSLSKRKILVTGSSRGIGRAIARQASSQGLEVILHGKRVTEDLCELASELSAEILTFDVTSERQIGEAFSRLASLDILVNSAGINISRSFEELKAEEWQKIFDVNLYGMVSVTKIALPLLKNSSHPRIVNIGSVKGNNAAVGRCAYSASKAAVSSLTAGMAREFSPHILVNCVAPGFIDTDMTRGTKSARVEKQINDALLGRMGKPEEIAALVLFLASESASFITGQTIYADGGFSIKKD